MIRREAELFFGALRFFTRLPVPAWVGHSVDSLNHAARYFPLVGLLVGAIGAIAFLAAHQIWPGGLAVLAAMVATILATGAFHEDGWADACDGLGGGWDKPQVLAIMKDSRLGTYGAIGLTLMLLAKFLALSALPVQFVAIALLVAHPASRLASTALIAVLDYVRDDDSARAKPLAQRMSRGEFAAATAFGIAPLALLPALHALFAAAAATVATALLARYLVRRIGGYTGDCLGATQQLAEVSIYLALVAAWNFG